MTRPFCAAVLAALAFCGGAAAQTPPTQTPPAAPARLDFVLIRGVVSGLAADTLSLKAEDGSTKDVPLASDWYVVVATPVDFDAIKPGSFIASANLQEPNGEGQALELRMFEPGSKLGEGNRPMPQPNTMMTNATVSKVSKGADGRSLDVVYPGGVRHIVVPPNIKVIASVPGDRSMVKPGVSVTTVRIDTGAGFAPADRISIDPPKPVTP